jgi:hypothetical protein
MYRKLAATAAILTAGLMIGAPALAALTGPGAHDRPSVEPDTTTTAKPEAARLTTPGEPKPKPTTTIETPEPVRPAVKPADGPHPAERPGDGLRLACATAAPPERVVGCKWSQSQSAAFAAYELWSAGPERPRQVVFRTEDRSMTAFRDHPGLAGLYHYKVIAVNGGGQAVEESAVVSVKVGPDRPAPMRLECKPLASPTPSVACRWSVSESEQFAGYRLVRGDERGRHVVFETRDRNVTRALDERVEVGHTYKYAIVTVDTEGRVIAEGGPVTVTIPAGTGDALVK